MTAGRGPVSAALLLYREDARGALEVLICHPGGPFFRRRDAGAWTLPKGEPEPGEELAAAALRELREETGLVPERLYNVSRVDAFYQHTRDEVALIPVFAALVAAGATPLLSPEHDRAEWLRPDEAAPRFAWPRERRALADILSIVGAAGGETGGLLDDVLRVS
jgi:dATP pyrophosphohydrolase